MGNQNICVTYFIVIFILLRWSGTESVLLPRKAVNKFIFPTLINYKFLWLGSSIYINRFYWALTKCKVVPLGTHEELMRTFSVSKGFPGNSVGKDSTCNAGDASSIPGSRRSAGEGIGYPFQYSWASLVAQLVKNLPTMWDTWVRSLGWEVPLKKGTATHSSILAWRIPRTV